MKIRNSLFILITLFTWSLHSESVIKIGGSSTLHEVTESMLNSYSSENKEAKFENSSTGSGSGFEELLEGKVDIAKMSRGLNLKELYQIKASKKNIRPFQIGYDAICIVAHSSLKNDLKKLTYDDIKNLYLSGASNKWSKQASKISNKKITVFSAEKTSGTSRAFLELIGGTDYSKNVSLTKKSSDVVKMVEKTPNSIGVASFGTFRKSEVVSLLISQDGEEFSSCTPHNVKEGKYLLNRGLFYVLNYPPNIEVAKFLDYVLGSKGQDSIKNHGLVPIR